MEKLKDPAMVLSVTNSIAVVGTTVYFYKQLETIRLDLFKMSQTLQGVLRKIAEEEKKGQQNGEALHLLNEQIKRVEAQIEDIPSFVDVDNIDADVSEIIATLGDSNIPVERPSRAARYIPSGDRRPNHRHQDTNERDRREPTRPAQRPRNGEGSRPSRAEPDSRVLDSRPLDSRVLDSRPLDSRRSTTKDTRNTQPRQEQSYDDSDLIDMVRGNQQPRN